MTLGNSIFYLVQARGGISVPSFARFLSFALGGWGVGEGDNNVRFRVRPITRASMPEA